MRSGRATRTRTRHGAVLKSIGHSRQQVHDTVSTITALIDAQVDSFATAIDDIAVDSKVAPAAGGSAGDASRKLSMADRRDIERAMGARGGLMAAMKHQDPFWTFRLATSIYLVFGMLWMNMNTVGMSAGRDNGQ